MGLKQREDVTYLKIKDGKFYRSSDKELKEPFTELEGKIVGMNFRTDEWEGQEIYKLVITVDDGADRYVISWSFDSSYTTSLVGFLKNADLSQVLSIVPVEKVDDKDKTKKRRSLLVKQGGKFLKAYYTKDGDHQPPAMVQTVQNRKKVWDKTEYLQFYEDVINNELIPEVSSETPTPVEKPKKVTVDSVVEDLDSEIENDLPF